MHAYQPLLLPQPAGILGWIRLPAAHPSAPAALPQWLTATVKTRYSAAHSCIDQYQWNRQPNGQGAGVFPLAPAATLSVSEALWSHDICFNHQSLIDHLLKSYGQRAPLTFCPVWSPLGRTHGWNRTMGRGLMANWCILDLQATNWHRFMNHSQACLDCV